MSTWTESYEPYDYAGEYDQSSTASIQATQTTEATKQFTVEATKTTKRSETPAISSDLNSSFESAVPSEVFTTEQTATQSTAHAELTTKSYSENDLELDCDNDSVDDIRTMPTRTTPFYPDRGSVQSVFNSQFGHETSRVSSMRKDSPTTSKILIGDQGSSGIQNVINCFGTFRNTSCIRQLCKVSTSILKSVFYLSFSL